MAEGNGPYTIETLIDDVPIPDCCRITCCEFWESNLYIGTSASEILHFVSIPDESTSRPQFILASRLEPSPPSSEQSKGVQQIVVLAPAGKACILCNGALTFHSLPELSPVGGRKVSGCTWVGGKDLNLRVGSSLEDATTLLVCTRKRTRLVRISDEAQVIKNIEYPDCLTVARRGRFACVADLHSYSLLDVENQQKIPLFPISSLDEEASPATTKKVVRIAEDGLSDRGASPSRPGSSVIGEKGHGRTTSLGQFVGGLRTRLSDERSPSRSSLDLHENSGEGAFRPAFDTQTNEAEPSSPRRHAAKSLRPESPSQGGAKGVSGASGPLNPHVVSPSPSEFLVTVGTDPSGPAMGMFVNCDGDVARGNLNFDNYPIAIALDEGAMGLGESPSPANSQGSYVLAATKRRAASHVDTGIEIQAWNGEAEPKSWILLSREMEPPEAHAGSAVGVVATESGLETSLSTIGDKLRAQRFWPQSDSPVKEQSLTTADQTRMHQEEEFAKRLGKYQTRIVVWNHHSISSLIRAPLVVQLEASLNRHVHNAQDPRAMHASLLHFLMQVRTIEPHSEAEFLSLEYIRQKISILLLVELSLHRFVVDSRFREELLLEGGADPRIILSLIPLLKRDIFIADEGMWIHAGLVSLLKERYHSVVIALDSDDILSRPEKYEVLGLLKRYLMAWRQRKGFGSIADEIQVFSTVDAALLHVLLHQDQQSKLGPDGSSSLRAEIYFVVDGGVDCFDHAVMLLEDYGRLYILSRLYQSRRMSAKVLSTWRRILDGENDVAGEFADGENEVRKYLAKRGDAGLVEEYGVWLARRNPSLGVQVFTDGFSRVRLPPRHVVQLLQAGAPDAVKVFLEHLVFGKKDVGYAEDLLTYYLDSVLGALSSSAEARLALVETYETYRALQAPKPTYHQFITDNALATPWWSDRLRLLELLGGTYGSAFSYDVSSVLSRIATFEDALVPESIILEGRQGHHQQALHLLIHGMGDYHTAINYCLLGGSSIFHPASESVKRENTPGPDDQAVLFRFLLQEFLEIGDEKIRLEQTGELLGRFGPWFDVRHVLESIPVSWPVEIISTYLRVALRRLLQERNETMVTKALRGLENIKSSTEFTEKCKEMGPKIVPAMDTPTSMS